jgi:hypothetical protein
MSHSLQSSAVLTTVFSVEQAAEAANAGAQIVDAGDDGSLVIAIRHARIDVLVCGPGSAADVGRDIPLAARTGAWLLCDGLLGDGLLGDGLRGDALSRDTLSTAEQARRQGIDPARILVQVRPAEVGAAGQAGWLTVVDVDDDAAGTKAEATSDAEAAAGARASVCVWLGASVIRTRHVTQIRRCLDMSESIRGTRAPAWAVRGLA